MRWLVAADSDIGGRDEQQDRIAVLHAIDGHTHLLAVADGAGGHGNGALAAQTVIDTVQKYFSRGVLGEPLGYLERVCMAAHEAVTGLSAANGLPPASTCVLLLLRDREAYWAHVGDSRLYHLRGEKVLHQTADHSMVQFYADSAGSEESAGANLPPASNQLYMCLGARREILPETNASLVAPHDSFLLCSDGFWGQVPIDEVAGSLSGKKFNERAVQEWVKQAKLRGGDRADNISLVFARLLPDSRNRLLQGVRPLWDWFRTLLPGRNRD